MIIYNVKPGDTLWKIGQRFGVPVQSIVLVNGLDQPDYLVVGMDLVIPDQDMILEYYTVRPGDSLWSIANRYEIPLAELIHINRIQPPYIIYPNQVLIIGQRANDRTRPTIETLGYYNPAADPNKPALIDSLGIHLTYLGIFEFPITETGQITGTMDPEVLAAAERNQVAPLPVLTNIRDGVFDPDLMRTLITSPDSIENLIQNTLNMLTRDNLIGVLLDLENLYPEDRDLFTNFIRMFSAQLHEAGKILVLNMAAKWADLPDRPWAGFFDYNALGPLIDIAAIMTYEWGYREGPPHPTAPLLYVQRVIEYAIANNVPADKILMGMTLYGYDWVLPDTPENLATTVTLPRVWDLARSYYAPILYNEEVQQPTLRYTDAQGQAHEVWFENARSHYQKYQLVLTYGLRGVFYWIIHMPFASTWYMVSQLFHIRKL